MRLQYITLLPCLLCLLGFSPLMAQEKEDTLSYEVSARLMVKDRQQAANSLTEWAEEQNGYYVYKTQEQIIIRLPDKSVDDLRAYLEEISEELVEYSQNTYDLRERLLASHSALEAREEILAKNISYIASSDVEGTLTLEQEIRRLMNEIDMYRGIIRKMENDRNYALITLMLSFQNQTIPDSLPSKFDWINSVDFYEFIYNSRMNDTLYNRPGFGGPRIELPEGFALIDNSPEYLAISPEGVKLRVRKTDNYPKQSLIFWQEALFSYLSNRGYIPMGEVSEGDFGDTPFAIRNWGVSYGNEDYLYLTGIRLVKSKIEILEIAGPAQFVREYFSQR